MGTQLFPRSQIQEGTRVHIHTLLCKGGTGSCAISELIHRLANFSEHRKPCGGGEREIPKENWYEYPSLSSVLMAMSLGDMNIEKTPCQTCYTYTQETPGRRLTSQQRMLSSIIRMIIKETWFKQILVLHSNFAGPSRRICLPLDSLVVGDGGHET